MSVYRKLLFSLLVLLAAGFGLPCSAQAPACTAGTLASVLGTSCSVGPITINFSSGFSGSLFVVTQGTLTNVPISPSEIGFVPLQSGNQAGFRLVTNFADGPALAAGSSSEHLVQFSYLPQSNTGFDIVSQTDTLDAKLQNAPGSDAFALALDDQCYDSFGCTQLFPELQSVAGVTQVSQPSQSVSPEIPALVSTSGGMLIQNGATGSAQANLASVTVMFTVGTFAPPPPPAPLTYSNIDLQGQASTSVGNINNEGDIVGGYQDALGAIHGYITRKSGEFISFDFPGAAATGANGVNDRGDVVGAYTDIAGRFHAFLLRDGVFSDIDTPPSIFSSAVEINNQGEIAGFYRSAEAGFHVHAFLIDSAGFHTIDHGPSAGRLTITQAQGLNNRSEIAGSFFDPFTFHAFTERKELFQQFDVPGQGDTIPQGLNDRGDVVGTYNDVNLAQHGFIRTGAGFLTVDFPDGNTSFPLGINASGTIVGQYFDADGNTHSFLAEPSTAGADNGNSATAQPRNSQAPRVAPALVCGSAEWQRHPEQSRSLTTCRLEH